MIFYSLQLILRKTLKIKDRFVNNIADWTNDLHKCSSYKSSQKVESEFFTDSISTLASGIEETICA